MNRLLPLVLLTLLAVLAIPQNSPLRPGPHPDGGYLLVTGWRVAPAGIQVPLPDTQPMNLVMHPDGKSLFVLNAGYTPPSVIIMSTADPKQAARVSLDDAWMGLAMNKAGDRFYVPEGNLGTVREFSYARGQVKPLREFRLFSIDTTKKGRDRLPRTDYLSDATLWADGKWLFVANLQANLVHAIDLEKGDTSRKFPVGRHPYRLLATADRLYASNWGGESITVVSLAAGPEMGKVRATVQTGPHPTDMLLHGGRLYVA